MVNCTRIAKFLPPKKLLVLALIVASLNPLLSLYLALTPPEGKTFVAHWSEAYQLTLLRSVEWGFEDPWGEGWTVFHNPLITPAYVYVPLGTLPTLLGVPAWPYLLFLKFMIGLGLLLVVYNFCRRFAGIHANTAFLLYILAGSLGWVLYAGVYFVYGLDAANIVAFALTTEFGEYIGGANVLAHLTQVYWMLPEITALLGILFFSIGRRFLAGICLGLTFLFYPTWGVAAIFGFGLYALVENWGKPTKLLIVGFLSSIKYPAGLLLVLAVPWVVTYFQMPTTFNLYLETFTSQLPSTLLLSSVVLSCLALYDSYSEKSSVLRRPAFVLLFCLFAGLLSAAYFFEKAVVGKAEIMIGYLQSAGLFIPLHLLFDHAIFIFVPMALLIFYASLRIISQERTVVEKFTPLWILTVVVISTVPVAYSFWWPARMQYFLLLPLAVAAAPGVGRLAAKNLPLVRKSHLRIIGLIFLVSIPTFIGFNYRYMKLSVQDDTVYLPTEDVEALRFLATQPSGRVLASSQIAYNTPYLSGQRSLLSDFPDNRVDVLRFFSNTTAASVRAEILQSRNITYIFFGSFEKRLYGSEYLDVEDLDLIYNKSTRIYKVPQETS